VKGEDWMKDDEILLILLVFFSLVSLHPAFTPRVKTAIPEYSAGMFAFHQCTENRIQILFLCGLLHFTQ
jgi:hypothetical protein